MPEIESSLSQNSVHMEHIKFQYMSLNQLIV